MGNNYLIKKQLIKRLFFIRDLWKFVSWVEIRYAKPILVARLVALAPLGLALQFRLAPSGSQVQVRMV